MYNSELKEIKSRLECPNCNAQGKDIELFFINESSDEVSFQYVNQDQEASDFAHMCYCESCNHEDDRCFFDYVEYNKWKIAMHKFIQRKSLKEHSEVVY